MKLYKLTDKNMQTHKGFQWTLDQWFETSGEGHLCSPGWLHAYSDPTLALLMNPAHADFSNPRLFEAEGDGGYLEDSGLKCGVRRLRLVKELGVTYLTLEQRVRFAIYCALEVNKSQDFNRWAHNWLSGDDRSVKAANAAANAAEEANYAAKAAAYAAYAAADAANAAAYAAYAVSAAYAAADAAYAAADAAADAAYAAYAAAYAKDVAINFIVIAQRAVKTDEP